jgi:hypothetical protein
MVKGRIIEPKDRARLLVSVKPLTGDE